MKQRRLFRVRLRRIAVTHPHSPIRDVSVALKAKEEAWGPVSEAERRRMEAEYLAVRAGQGGGLFQQ